MIKTNKSYIKRLKITRTGKILGRKIGQNHFNAKEGGNSTMSKHRMRTIRMSNKIKSRFLANI